MSLNQNRMLQVVCLLLVALWSAPAGADPLSGQVLKFQQLPLNDGIAVPAPSGFPPNLAGQAYHGHDEWSTAYWIPAINAWRGDYMADDFGDKVSTPVVHVRWWGSYDQNITGNNGVQRFLIAFENDVPAAGANSHPAPGPPISSQIVTPGALSPGSGTFTQSVLNNTPGTEFIYQYNAELAVPFNQAQDTVYWLKIVALVDQANDGNMKWGWHTRDWSQQDTYASTFGLSVPGEFSPGTVSSTFTPVWTYQDAAVTGLIDVIPIVPSGLVVNQTNWAPQNYDPNIDGPSGGGVGIGNIEDYHMDLAFELYTTPEPSSVVLGVLGVVGLAGYGWRKRRRGVLSVA